MTDLIKFRLSTAMLALCLAAGQPAPASAASLANLQSEVSAGFHWINETGLPRWEAAHDAHEVPLLVSDTQEQQPRPAPRSDDSGMGIVGTTILTLFVETIACLTVGICAITFGP